MKNKLILAGGRWFNEYSKLCIACDKILSLHDISEIVSGGASGADALGERYAKDRNLPVKLFSAQWDTYGKSAGYRRNEEMAEYATHLIAFWDGESKGTKHMINLAHRYHLHIKVINY